METEEKLRRWWRSAKVSKFTGDKFSSSAVKLLKRFSVFFDDDYLARLCIFTC